MVSTTLSLQKDIDRIREKIMDDLASDMQKEVKKQILQYHAWKTGALYRSVDKRAYNDGSYEVRPTVKYAFFVNYGIGPEGRRIPKPFFTSAFLRIVNKWEGKQENE